MPLTEDQLNRALVNAHRAGDTQAAEQLAREIIKFRANDPKHQAAKAEEERVLGLRQQFEHGYKRPVPTGEGVARSILQGTSYGFGEEATAALGALLQPITGEGNTGTTFGERYDAYLEHERNKLRQFREEQPVKATVAEVAGAIPTAVALPGGPAATSLLGRTASGALTGGYQGALYGYGAGEGSPIDRAENAAKFGMVGGTLGAAAPAAIAGGRNLANYLLRGQAARNVGMSRPAYDVIMRSGQADDALSGTGAQRIRQGGPTAMMADAGPSMQQTLDATIVGGGPAARIAREAIDDRLATVGRSVQGQLNRSLTGGVPVPQGQSQMGPRALARITGRASQARRGEAYEAAYNTAINYADETGQRIEGVLRRVPDRLLREAVEEANEDMVANGLRNQQIMANIADDGTVTFTEMPNVQQLDEIKKALQRIRYGDIDNFGRATAKGARAGRLARELREALGDAVPAYNDAVQAGADKIAIDNAIDLGQNILSRRMTREMVREATEGMVGAERTAAATSLRMQIDDALANVQRTMTDPNVDARETMQLVKNLSSRANREKVAALLGDDAADDLFRELDQAGQAFNLRAATARNSATAPRQIMQDVIKQQTEGGALNTIRSADVGQIAKWPFQAVMRRTPAAKQAVTDRVQEEVARTLTGPRAGQAIDTLLMMQRAAADNPQAAERWGRLAGELMRRNPALSAPLLNRRSGTRQP